MFIFVFSRNVCLIYFSARSVLTVSISSLSITDDVHLTLVLIIQMSFVHNRPTDAIPHTAWPIRFHKSSHASYSQQRQTIPLCTSLTGSLTSDRRQVDDHEQMSGVEHNVHLFYREHSFCRLQLSTQCRSPQKTCSLHVRFVACQAWTQNVPMYTYSSC